MSVSSDSYVELARAEDELAVYIAQKKTEIDMELTELVCHGQTFSLRLGLY